MRKEIVGDLVCVLGHTLDVDKVKLSSIVPRVERVKRRDWLLVETTKSKPRQRIAGQFSDEKVNNFRRCEFWENFTKNTLWKLHFHKTEFEKYSFE